MTGGYMGRLLCVDLTKGTWTDREISEELARKYIGGSGLGARLLFDQTRAETDPLGEDNVLMFLTGPLTETAVPMAGRYAVVTKSPLGIWGEGDCGGSWGSMLKRTGYDGILVVGRSEKPVYLWITDEGVSLRDAGHLWGRDTIETDEMVKAETSAKAVVACIGPAGEKLAKMAVVLSDGKHARVSGRGGVGAVMGSKKLKAISVYGARKPQIARPEALKALVKSFVPRLQEATKAFGAYGTAGAVIKNANLGDMPVKNWSSGKWDDEKLKKISGQTLAETILTKKYYCKGCIVGCGRVIEIADGPYAGVSGGGPEYETLGSFGSLCLIDDLNAISMANDLCNRYGMDTVSVGASIAFAMEAYEKGTIGKKDTGGIDLAWGNKDAALAMVHQIGRREGLGRLLGEGVKRASQEIGGGSADFAIEVKGLELPMHDPRSMGSLAVLYATYPRGACHRGCSYQLERSGIAELGYEKPLERQRDEGKALINAVMQDYAGLFNSLKLCQFVITQLKPSEVLQCLNDVTGWDMDLPELMRAGERASNVKRMYNVRLGYTRKDDTLPQRILSEKFTTGGAAGYLPNLEKMLDEYYGHRRWSSDGIPLPSTLRELGLNDEAEVAARMFPDLSRN
ncbi:MAG: putative oxidoreductase YdhV [Syntrophaceae bacterium PtaU1.Bin231]|nr:MAG: putative oxidoreductase YdhV [Syntrophaceae bacterium PtaU1.Bin231]